MLIDQFQEFAARLEERIDRSQPEAREGGHIGPLAAAELRESRELLNVDPARLLHEIVSNPAGMPSQPWDNNFGHPGLTLVESENFRVDVIYWLQNACSIHSHVSCGAFAAMRGRRLHVAYEYDLERAWDDVTSTGTLTQKLREIMRVPDVHEISPNLTHELYWIEKPAVTVSVRCRTHPSDAEHRPYDFMVPGLRYVPAAFQSESTVSRWLSGLQLLLRANKKLFRDALDLAAREAPATFLVHALRDLADIPEADMEMLLRRMSELRADGLIESVRDVVDEFRRRDVFSGMYVPNIHAQFLAAVLWSGATGEDFVSLCRAEGYDDPYRLMADHAATLVAKNAAAAPYLRAVEESI
ncbi:hypothetical protein [Nocardioides zeae]|uniref:Uncharacterized protein n=1 Tax=Nocardioides zeae TaxID=1457234 RepID=A0A6P0HM72_9ACTN|nr:hypothetical protein [Nocardioides zeae]NEN79782.1 hypothetical protein [Nocardioides zeae]